MRGLLIAVGIAVAAWLVALLALIALGRRSQARELATLIPNLLVLFRGLLSDPRVPRTAKLWLVFAVVWIASPIDLVPEFIPVAGPLDDAIVAALVLRHPLRRTDRSVVFEHWRGDAATLEAFVRETSAPRSEDRPFTSDARSIRGIANRDACSPAGASVRTRSPFRRSGM